MSERPNGLDGVNWQSERRVGDRVKNPVFSVPRIEDRQKSHVEDDGLSEKEEREIPYLADGGYAEMRSPI